MSDAVFVDANVLVYARDTSDPAKQARAAAWMGQLWRSRRGRTSFQVLHEFYVTVTLKLRPRVEVKTAREDVRNLMRWKPPSVDASLLETAWRAQDRFRLSFWDALVVAAATAQDCRYLLSEDLQAGQDLGELTVVNPFLAEPRHLA